MAVVSEHVGQFFYEGHRIEYTEYTEYGGGDRWVVLIHGQLMPRRMHHRLARALAAGGARVVTVDLLGHGASDRPTDPLSYSVHEFAEQVLALLDDVGAESAVLGGTSVGANVALTAAVTAPERVRGLLLEMPVLHNAVEPGILTFAPLLFLSRTAPWTVTLGRWASRAVPRTLVPFWAGVGLDLFDQRPAAMAATIHGIFFGAVAPSSRDRRAIDVPALVVGHGRDPIHPAADAAMVAEELPNAEFVTARGISEWRARPQRLDAVAVEFVARCYDEGVRRTVEHG